MPQIVEKNPARAPRHARSGFSVLACKEYPRREQVMQYGEDDLRFISRLLGEVGIWFRFYHRYAPEHRRGGVFTTVSRVWKGLTLPSVPPSGQHSQGVDSVEWRVIITWCRSRSAPVITTTASDGRHEHPVDATRGDATTYGDAYHYADNYLAPEVTMTAIRPWSPRFTPAFVMSVT